MLLAVLRESIYLVTRRLLDPEWGVFGDGELTATLLLLFATPRLRPPRLPSSRPCAPPASRLATAPPERPTSLVASPCVSLAPRLPTLPRTPLLAGVETCPCGPTIRGVSDVGDAVVSRDAVHTAPLGDHGGLRGADPAATRFQAEMVTVGPLGSGVLVLVEAVGTPADSPRLQGEEGAVRHQ